jgi:hypothetical protein
MTIPDEPLDEVPPGVCPDCDGIVMVPSSREEIVIRPVCKGTGKLRFEESKPFWKAVENAKAGSGPGSRRISRDSGSAPGDATG